MKVNGHNPPVPVVSERNSAACPRPVTSSAIDDRFVRPGEEPYVFSQREQPVALPGMRADLDAALGEALADGTITTVEWETLKPLADSLDLKASEGARKLVQAYADAGVTLEKGAQTGLSKFLISRGYDTKGARQTGAEAAQKIIDSNVSETDTGFADIVAKAGKTDTKAIVGIIDSGFDSSHVAFEGKLWVNEGEIAGDGIDNDGNGIIDDVHGADFVDRDGDPNNVKESSGHATHVTGIATRGTDQVNAIMLRGFARTLEPQDIADAIDYAAANGAKVINMSFKVRTPEAVKLVTEAMARHPDVLFVKSAGNDNRDLSSYDALAYLPKNSIPNMIISSAANKQGGKASYSNYGLPWSTHAAVGDVLSTLPGNRFMEYGGTSMSSPNTTAAAGKMLVLDPALTAVELKEMLHDTSTPSSIWEPLTEAGGLIDQGRAYKLAGLTGLVRENAGMTGEAAADQLGLTGDERTQLLALLPKYVQEVPAPTALAA